MAWRRRSKRVELIDVIGGVSGGAGLAEPPPDRRPALRRIAAEALILQDEAEAVLRDIRARQPLGYLAPRGGPLVRRFFALRDALPERCETPEDEAIRGQLAVILHYHAMALSTAMELLAYEWRSPDLARQLDGINGLGQPALVLEDIYAHLAESRVPHTPTSSALGAAAF